MKLPSPPPPPTGAPPPPSPDRASALWARLAGAQDQVLSDRAPLGRLERALVQRISQRRPTPRRWRPMVALGSAALSVGAVVLVLLARTPPLRFQVGPAGLEGAPGAALVARAGSELPLQFTDGSSVTFRPGSGGRVQRLTGAGAEVVLERGTLEAHVFHADRTLWMVHAGPFRVRVTGTRFTTSWSPATQLLAIALLEGSVLVDGDVLGAGVTLRAGQNLSVNAGSGVVSTEPLAPAAADGTIPPPTAARPADPMAASAAPNAATAAIVNAGATTPAASANVAANVDSEQPGGAPRDTTPTRAFPVTAAAAALPSSATTPASPAEIPATTATTATSADDPTRGGTTPRRSPRASDARDARDARAAARTIALRPSRADSDSAGVASTQTGPASEAPSSAELALAAPASEGSLAAAAAFGAGRQDWHALADRGAYAEALRSAERVGFQALCQRLDARDLLALGDVARYAGAPADARLAFSALARRFPRDRLAADALFSLGRLSFESRRLAEASDWFQRYLRDFPAGPLAEQAAGRLLESALAAGDQPRAREAARLYLGRAPQGPHAALARRTLAPADAPGPQ